MKLGELFELLGEGELSSANLGDNVSIGVTTNNYKKLIGIINLGLTDIHSRFNLRVKELYLQLVEPITVYTLHSKYRYYNTASTEPIKYIIDTPDEEFKDDLLSIIAVYDSAGGLIDLNSSAGDRVVFTPSYNQLQVPYYTNGELVSVAYRCTPNKVLWSTTVDLMQEVDIPHSMVQALLFYVAYKVYSSRLDADSIGKGGLYYQQYEAVCMQSQNQGLLLPNGFANYKLNQNGWV